MERRLFRILLPLAPLFAVMVVIFLTAPPAVAQSEVQRALWVDLRAADSQCKISFVGGQGPLKFAGLTDAWEVKSLGGDLATGDLRLQARAEGTAKLDVQVTGSPVNLSLFARQCQILLQNWRADSSLNVAAGAVNITGKTAELNLWMSEGRAKFSQVSGDILFVSDRAELQAEGGSGRWDLQSQQGALNVQGFSGQVQMRLGQSTGTLKEVEGTQRLEIYRGVAILQSPKGQVFAQMEEGQLRATLGTNDVQMQVRSERGKTNVNLNGKGAWLDLITKDGDLVPASLGLKRVAGDKVAKGRLTGSPSRTSVMVRSESGSVVVR